MSINTIQLIGGFAYVEKIGQESRSQTAFAAYDALSPDEPGRALRFVKWLLHLPARFAKSNPAVRSQTITSQVTQNQTTPLFE